MFATQRQPAPVPQPFGRRRFPAANTQTHKIESVPIDSATDKCDHKTPIKCMSIYACCSIYILYCIQTCLQFMFIRFAGCFFWCSFANQQVIICNRFWQNGQKQIKGRITNYFIAVASNQHACDGYWCWQQWMTANRKVLADIVRWMPNWGLPTANIKCSEICFGMQLWMCCGRQTDNAWTFTTWRKEWKIAYVCMLYVSHMTSAQT